MQDNLLGYSQIATAVVLLLIAATAFVSVVRKQARKKYQGLDQLIQSHYETFNSLAQQKELESSLRGICNLIESQIDGSKCAIMVVDHEKNTLSTAATVSLPSSFSEALDGLDVADGVGACGTAAAIGEPVLVADMRKDQRFNQFSSLIEQYGLVSCWSHPIFCAAKSEVIGTFSVYFSEPRMPVGRDLELIVRNRDLVALLIEQEDQRKKQARLEQHQRSLFTYNPDAVFTLDLAGHFTSVNRAVCELLLLGEESLLGKHYELAVIEADQSRTLKHFEAAKAGTPQSYEIKIHDRTGQLHDLSITNIPIIIDGEITGVHGIAKDITEHRANEAKLKVFQSGVHASVNGVVISEANEKGYPVIYVNPAFEKMSGYSLTEIKGRSCRLLQGNDTDPNVQSEIRSALRAKREIKTIIRNYRKDGSMFWNELLISPVKGAKDEVTHFIGLQSDITERIQREEALEFYASHDSLTKLANRSAMETRLQKLLGHENETSIFVLFIDLDGFKPINDSLGHYLGDEVLIETAQRLQQVILEPNLLCRFGGDEFVAVIEDMSAAEQVDALCTEILAVFEKPFRIGEVEVSLSAAIGVSANDIQYGHPMELTQRADVAMYEAKKRGGNFVCWYSSRLDEGLGYKVALRTKIQEALAQEQFELFYQPIMTDKGKVSGVEALIRWQHPTKGYVSPGDFIPIAERTGQIIQISEWVLKKACHDLTQLKQYGIKSVSVNFSPIQFYRDDFVSKTKAILEQFDIQPGEITVEITENVLVNDTQRIAELLQQLRDLGMDVAIDDFGSGFASLRYLNVLPVNKLKIDRSFIEDIDQNAHNAAITCGILNMVADIGIETVAEGVETEAECKYLVEHGCHFMQGFLFCKPKPLDELLKWAERQHSFENED
ncbi:EAL domain-containing protein [Idiomarina ramblicola]|uniref:Bifunctional diguanylate cyclase/phosphodiesterase n=1 Tax=Idiomarina ramblicola TaxID=263724 RepID=A0A432YUN8_9GAMM|nr:EAL domain-containing protein [Idiomarina ramblicola]RUO67039.1 bifunctional diguanylate cyclase/phosphodiesterase [Idiomarina ramblicola]